MNNGSTLGNSINENGLATDKLAVPDDASDLCQSDLGNATCCIGQRMVFAAEGVVTMREHARRGRPHGTTKADAKRAVTIRYSQEVLDAFRASGPGWQVRMNDALRDWLRTHTLA